MLRPLKMLAYAKAPVKTFAALHPLRFVKYAALFWIGRKLWDRLTREEGRERPRLRAGRVEGRRPDEAA